MKNLFYKFFKEKFKFLIKDSNKYSAYFFFIYTYFTSYYCYVILYKTNYIIILIIFELLLLCCKYIV